MKIHDTKQINCDLCGKPGARLRQVSENVPMVDCPHCGEAYFTAETLHEVERLKRQRHARAVASPVAVLSYT
jgi:hypothetical protein